MNFDFRGLLKVKKDTPIYFISDNYFRLAHEVLFLNSLLHDAVYYWSKKFLTHQKVKFNIVERQCWEFEDLYGNWACARSELRINPVLSAKIEPMDEEVFFDGKPRRRIHEMTRVYLGEDYWENYDIFPDIGEKYDDNSVFTLIIQACHYNLRIKLPGHAHSLYPFMIELKDTEGPFRVNK